MGNDEAIIYGDRHGERYFEYTDKNGDPVARPEDQAVTVVEKAYYPNAIKLSTLGGRGVALGVITFDQETGEQNRFYGEDDQWDSLWSDLDRQAVNRLIKELKRMRNRVWGADE